jgi:hypothetical protein
MLLLRRCYNRITPLSLTNCALLAWTVSESVKGWTQPNRSPALALSLSSHLLVRRALASGASSASAPTNQDCPASQPRGMRVEVAQVPCLQDNYGYLLHDPVSGQTASIDTPDARALTSELERRGWTLTHIWNTHQYVKKERDRSSRWLCLRLLTLSVSAIVWLSRSGGFCSHWDHTGGNRELKAAHPGLQVIGPAGEQAKIPGIDVPVGDGDAVSIGSIEARVIDVGGHTRGHIAYHLPSEKVVFVGDALFSLGCGRMFEGTPRQFWASLQRLRSLPDDTAVYWYEFSAGLGSTSLP